MAKVTITIEDSGDYTVNANVAFDPHSPVEMDDMTRAQRLGHCLIDIMSEIPGLESCDITTEIKRTVKPNDK